MQSCIPPCRFCNRVSLAHFPLECAQVWEEWEKKRFPCYKCQQYGADHISEECWIMGDQQQTREELTAGLEVWAKQMEFCLEGNKCPLCLESLLHNWHTIENCLEDHSRQLTDENQQAFPRNEVTWRIYEGDIEVTMTWNKPSSGLKKCEFCNKRRPLHYPKECLQEAPICHPCLFCGMDRPDHVPEDCPTKDDESQARNTDELFHQCIWFQRALLYQKICYIYAEHPPLLMAMWGSVLGENNVSRRGMGTAANMSGYSAGEWAPKV